MIDQNQLPGISLALEEQQALVRRATASELFRRSPRQRELLAFIAAEQFASRSRDITEQHIGRHVFGRAEGYNQSEDNIVRVSVRQLRTRLKSHFEAEGRLETWTIEIPKGGYHLEFHPREEKSTELPAGFRHARLRPRTLAWAVSSCTICLLAGFWMGDSHRMSASVRPPGTAPSGADAAVNELFAGSDLVNVVVADTGLLHLLAGRQVTLEEYARPALFALPKPSAVPPDKTQDVLVTSLADVSFVSRILQSPGTLRDRVRVLHARNANPSDFMTNSAVILGGPRVNPWSEFFESRLNFQFRYRDDGPGCIANRRPRTLERSVYGPCAANDNDRYARIAWLPNLTDSGQVLIVSGSGMLATENACDYLLAPGSAARLRSVLGIGSLRGLGYFELLLQTDSRAGVPSGNQMIASRVTAERSGALP